MSEREKCPFCFTEINLGATVCTGCGAYKGNSIESLPPLASLMILVMWLAVGPGAIVYGLTSRNVTVMERLFAIAIGATVTFFGWKFLNWLLFRPVWFRRR